jgi:hypothetical protein
VPIRSKHRIGIPRAEENQHDNGDAYPGPHGERRLRRLAGR